MFQGFDTTICGCFFLAFLVPNVIAFADIANNAMNSVLTQKFNVVVRYWLYVPCINLAVFILEELTWWVVVVVLGTSPGLSRYSSVDWLQYFELPLHRFS